jgi:DNA invertase Pin-like site-specific DNA recombinase
MSAWNPKVKRKQWEALMERLESGQAHGVWVYDLSRFTRKPLEGERLIALADQGVIVESAENTYNLRDADSKAHFRNDMTAAARESDKISQRVKRGKHKRALSGRSNAAWRPYALPGYAAKPDGWRTGDPREMAPVEQVEAERDVVREAARRLLAGETLKAVSRDFNDRGIPTPSGGEWYFHELQSLIKRPSMAGQITYKGETVGTLPGEPVLDAPTWAALQALLASRRRGPTPNRYLLSAGMMRCGWCGAKLAGRPQPTRTPYPDGEVRRAYWCAYRKDGSGCGKSLIDQRFADDLVSAEVLRRLGNPKHAARLTKQAAKATAERTRILGEIATADETGRAMAAKLGRGQMRQDRYDAFEAGLEGQLTRLRANLAAIDGPELPATAAKDAAKRWEEAEESGNLAVMRSMVREAFPRLTIRPPTVRGLAGNTPDRFDWYGESQPQWAKRGDSEA